MSMDAIRETFEAALLAEFPALHPGVPIAFLNTAFEQPKGAPWIHVAVLGGPLMRANVGNGRQFKQMGVVNVTCLVPENTGTKVANQLADSVIKILCDRERAVPAFGSVTTYGTERRDRGAINGWYSINVMCDFRAFVTLP